MRDIFPPQVEKARRSMLPRYPVTMPHEKNGFFAIKDHGVRFVVVISDGGGWDHVSVSIIQKTSPSRCPTWEEMCWVKNLFFRPDETVVQYHPAEQDYVDCHPSCLHLWRFQEDFPKPDPLMIGIGRKT